MPNPNLFIIILFSLGVIGIAAIFFAGSSPDLQHKIYSHPHFGKTVSNFVEHGVLTRKSKTYAITGSGAGTMVSLAIIRPSTSVLWFVVIVMLFVAVWLARRPEFITTDREDTNILTK